MINLALAGVALVMMAAIVFGLAWRLLTGNMSIAWLVLAPAWVLAWWWIAKGALRRRGTGAPRG